ncbi:eukaryotic translation initiation factor 5A-2-like [Etheostoma cragini]|uniref:eukaryotic translation initiation factor 5A-2-like n=1 Tax=Etheostoma cragini TaxID=417921 RepID=UPI00155DEDB2|nr:eukaryotic translation initiation factor 5A-2-like [Etheostoma cragini]
MAGTGVATRGFSGYRPVWSKLAQGSLPEGSPFKDYPGPSWHRGRYPGVLRLQTSLVQVGTGVASTLFCNNPPRFVLQVNLVGIDIFTNKKHEDMCPSTHNMDVPHIKRIDYQLVNIAEGYMTLMSDNGDIREDLRVPETEVGKEIETKFEAGDEFMVSVMARGVLITGCWSVST